MKSDKLNREIIDKAKQMIKFKVTISKMIDPTKRDVYEFEAESLEIVIDRSTRMVGPDEWVEIDYV